MKAFVELLQNRDEFIKSITEDKATYLKLMSMTSVAMSTLFIYGFIIGLQHSFFQALSSSVKLPVLFILTNIICFPTLFIFSSFFGSKRTLLQTLILIQAGTSMMGIVLTGLAPVTVFFMVTTDHYQFFKIMNVAFFAVAGITGIVFFNRFLAFSEASGDSQSSSRRYFSRFWFLLYAFVGTQLAWTLRPFFGNPDLSFTLFRGMGGNFYTDIVKSIGHIFGAN